MLPGRAEGKRAKWIMMRMRMDKNRLDEGDEENKDRHKEHQDERGGCG